MIQTHANRPVALQSAASGGPVKRTSQTQRESGRPTERAGDTVRVSKDDRRGAKPSHLSALQRSWGGESAGGRPVEDDRPVDRRPVKPLPAGQEGSNSEAKNQGEPLTRTGHKDECHEGYIMGTPPRDIKTEEYPKWREDHFRCGKNPQTGYADTDASWDEKNHKWWIVHKD